MKLERVTIRMGSTVPTEQFANIRPEVEITVSGEEPNLFNLALEQARTMFNQVKNDMMTSGRNMNNGGTWPTVSPPPMPHQTR